MLECGRPEELAEVQLLRYCGLPAYVRRLQERQVGPDQPSRALRRAWLYDEGEGVDLPIPFTSLDCLIPRLRGQGQPQGLEDLLERGPVGDVLLVSAHGSMSGGMANRSGFLVLGKERVNPAALKQRGDCPLQALVAMCCFGGVVGVGGAGDALGTISLKRRAPPRCSGTMRAAWCVSARTYCFANPSCATRTISTVKGRSCWDCRPWPQ